MFDDADDGANPFGASGMHSLLPCRIGKQPCFSNDLEKRGKKKIEQARCVFPFDAPLQKLDISDLSPDLTKKIPRSVVYSFEKSRKGGISVFEGKEKRSSGSA